jgi:hypothetical protein
MRVEVRCCCDPGKLLGWVELAGRAQIKEGDVLSLALLPERDMTPYMEAALYGSIHHEVLRLTVAFWQGEAHDFGKAWEREAGLALKSNDTPIETLRRIAGFQEAQ